MRMILLILVVLCLVTAISAADYRIVNTKSGKQISMAKMAADLAKYDVVFFGELHDTALLHKLELELLREIHKRQKNVIVSMEMFERDVQSYLNMYLSYDMDAEEFVLNSRPWPNYERSYRPLVDFAKEHKLPVIAANVPRSLAGRAVRNRDNFYETLNENETLWTAKEVYAPDDEYKEKFIAVMRENAAHGMPGDESMFEKLYYAQCLKDDTMAESIVKAIQPKSRTTLIHYNGDFHSRSFLGTAQRVMMQNPKLRVAVITVEHLPRISDYTYSKEHKKLGNYIITFSVETADEVD